MRTNEKVFYNNYTVRDRAVKTVSGTSTLSVSGIKKGPPASLVLYGDLRQDGIPEEYEELDYLEKADGGCYINTYLTNTLDFGFRIETAASDVTTARAMGGVSNSTGAAAASWCAYGIDNGSWTVSWGSGRYSHSGAVADVFGTIEVNFLNSGRFYVDSVLVQDGLVPLGQTALSNVALFGIWTASSLNADTTRNARIRRATFTYGTVVASDLFPCRRISDGELGMYDRVRKLFLTNAGASGTFTAGPARTPSPDRPVDLVCNNGVLKAGTGGTVIAEGAAETVTAQGNGSSASAEMLMGFAGRADTQDVLTGKVVRETKARVFDGTEDWQLSSSWEKPGTYVFYLTDGEAYHTSSDYARVMILCTHFPAYSRTSLYANDVQGCCLSGADNSAAYTFRCSKTDITGLTGWKAWLAGQYSAGSPVIAVVRRSSVLKSSVQKQAVTLLEGADTLAVSGYLRDLALSAEVYPQDTNIYKVSGTAPLVLPAVPERGFRKVTVYGGLEQNGTPTPTNPIPFVCNNGEIKVDSNGNVYCDGLTETLRIVESSSTATTEMLLKLGDYADSQELLSGIVSRRLGVKVFDGTETFTVSPNYRKTDACDGYCDISGYSDFPLPTSRVSALCTHFPFQSEEFIWLSTGYANEFATNHPSDSSRLQIHFNIANDILANYGYIYGDPDYGTTTAGTDAIKAWLTDQYNNGTPVIVVYPLPSEQTEQAGPQALAAVPGRNTLEITSASLSGLEVSSEYDKPLTELKSASGIASVALHGVPVDGLRTVTAHGGLEAVQEWPAIPSGYTQVSYIESEDTGCLIDTGVSGVCEVIIDVEGRNQAVNALQYVLACSDAGNGHSNFPNWFGRPTDTTSVQKWYGMYPGSLRSSISYGIRGQFRIYFDNGRNAGFLQGAMLTHRADGAPIKDNNVSFFWDGSFGGYTGTDEPVLDTASSFHFFGSPSGLHGATCRIFWCKMFQNNTMVRYFIPVVRNSDGAPGFYDAVGQQFYGNTGTGTLAAGSAVPMPTPYHPAKLVCNGGELKVNRTTGSVYVDGIPETVQVAETGSSAVAEALLKVYGHEDTQDLENGVIRRAISVKVLNGTEDWQIHTTSGYVWKLEHFCDDLAPGVPPQEACACTHFSPSGYYSTTVITEGYFTVSTDFTGIQDAEGNAVTDATARGGTLRVVFGLPTVEEVRQYLADQYNAGTPVIFAYPSAETVIEHVSPQKLLTAPGAATLEVAEASVPGLEISADWLAVSEELISADGTLPVPLPGFTGSGLKGVTAYGELRHGDTLSNYMRLDYLEKDSAGCYIDTGLIPDDDFGFKVVISCDDVVTDRAIIGCRESSSTNSRCWCGYTNNAYLGGWNAYFLAGGVTADTGFHEFKLNYLNSRDFSLDGTVRNSNLETLTTITQTFLLFGVNIGGTVSADTTRNSRIRSAVFTRRGQVIQYLIPVRRKSDNELGMYDTVSGTFFTNAGTGSFTAGSEKSNPSPELPVQLVCNNGPVLNVLPQGYTLLDYIEADNGQYITTNVSGPARWVGEAECTAEQSKSQCILSAACGAGALVYLASQIGTGSKVWSIGTDAASKTSLTTKSRTFYDLDYASATFSGTIGSGTVTATNAQTFTAWYIGTAFGAGSVNYPFTGKIYTQKAYQNGSLVFYGVPAKKISDGETGLFDLVTRTFFGNTSSGYFGAGPEHGSVVTGGPVEELGIGVRNMFDADELLGHRNRYEKQADGSWSVVVSDGMAWSTIYQNYAVLQPGTYTLSSTASAATFQYNGRDGTSHISGIGGSAWFSMPCTFTVTEPTEFNAKFRSGTTYPNSIGKIQLERNSSATAYTDYNGSTAAAEALFRLENYVDSQELVSGIVSRQLGVKVFDGTDSMTTQTNYRKADACDVYFNSSGWGSASVSGRQPVVCSHFPFADKAIWVSTGYANTVCGNHAADNPNMQLHFNISNDILANYGYIYGDPDYGTMTAGVAAVKAWMAAQYAAGTPVIVVYPLPEVTYSRVVPQPLADTPADQPLNVRQAALSGLRARASYMKERERVLSTASGTLPLALQGTDRDGIVSVTAKGSLSQGTLSQGYISLEYTGRYNNDGYPYIDTQWKPDLSKDITITGKAVYEGGTDYRAIIIGNYSAAAAAVLNLEFYNVNSRSAFRVYRSGSDAIYCGAFADGSEVEFSVVYTASTGVASVTTISGGVTATASGQLYHHGLQSDTSMRVFYDARSNQDSALKKTLKVGALTATEDGATVFDYVPAVCLENGLAGFFDRLTGQFLGNSGNNGTLRPTGGPSPDRQVAPVCNNGALVYDSVSGQVVVEGSPEALTVPGTGVSAIPETLLSLGDMTDTQDLLTGLVTRKLGIKVLTGSENWNLTYNFYIKSDATNMFFNIGGYVDTVTNVRWPIVCNGLTCSAGTTSIWSNEGFSDTIMSNGSFHDLQIHINISNSLTGVDPSTDTTATAKGKLTAYLAAKYSSGNPLFIIYPLPDTVTETVPAQKPVSLRGDSVLENEGEVEGLAADVTYNPPDC